MSFDADIISAQPLPPNMEQARMVLKCSFCSQPAPEAAELIGRFGLVTRICRGCWQAAERAEGWVLLPDLEPVLVEESKA